ncbi:hypothetical protein RchiOBHm_Chr5g0062241 [Rosa chinensis]|uniref:Uncharacterized protein n=1 Tax=Rosa chinensis TaxID=74649 RepID=A0A2P6QI61_ROSCH|nr:hypothetical protein RchiOBHm_Chr5g0062241 [Rosa chinensis]
MDFGFCCCQVWVSGGKKKKQEEERGVNRPDHPGGRSGCLSGRPNPIHLKLPICHNSLRSAAAQPSA